MQTLVLAALLRPISYYTGDSNATLQLQETDLHTAISTQNLADINADLNADVSRQIYFMCICLSTIHAPKNV